MSRFNPHHDLLPIFNAASLWRQSALESMGSVLGQGSIWTDENISSLKILFVDNPDEGEGTFLSKLERQIASAPATVKQLAAEMTWVMLLCPSNLSARNKRETVREIWSWSGSALVEDSPLLSDEVLAGIGSAGTAFNTQRWRELRFFIGFMQAFRALDIARRTELLTDGWLFAEWIGGISDADSRQLRHMLLYLLFPDQFERIFGRTDRRKLLVALSGMTSAKINGLSPLEIDRSLASIRAEYQAKFGRADLDFYWPPLKELWQREEDVAASIEQDDEPEVVRLGKLVTRDHVLRAIHETKTHHYPTDARSVTYDLVYGVDRFPPKWIFSIAVRNATGEEMPRTRFSGGESSHAFKVLRDLGFAIERKDLIPELVQKFVKQADEGVDMSTSSYAKTYRDLSVRVSFGQGRRAGVPWISFTGFGQTTSDGIYPVILYYREIGRLVVAYGISEQSAPKNDWRLADDRKTIADDFSESELDEPNRYGTSYVQAVFDPAENPDWSEVQAALDHVIGQYTAQFVEEPSPPPSNVYSIEEALAGLFMDEQQLKGIIALLRVKKNVILQGPPGVGKTYVAKRLAYALMEQRAPERLQMVQFHQSYSYEDFIQGFRPSGQGFRLKNGLFFDFCVAAQNDPANKYVFIIDEINRGNLSKVFGEAMMLIEADKRGKEWAIPLAYSESTDPRFYIPENLYVIGLMNTADRSLAMVDYALRRRFGFVDLRPQFDSDEFRSYLEERKADQSFVETLIGRMTALNSQIEADTANLGSGYCIGHSFFCCIPDGVAVDSAWFNQIIESDIAPLLREYYFDNPARSDALIVELLRP